MFVLGNRAELSNWNTAGGLALSSATYPVWRGTVNLPPNTTFEYKYIKKNGSAVTWESRREPGGEHRLGLHPDPQRHLAQLTARGPRAPPARPAARSPQLSVTCPRFRDSEGQVTLTCADLGGP